MQLPAIITSAQVIDHAAHLTGVPYSRIIGPRRPQHVAHIRFACYYVLRTHGISITAIGESFGGRTHKAITHGLQQARVLLKRSAWFAALVRSLGTK